MPTYTFQGHAQLVWLLMRMNADTNVPDGHDLFAPNIPRALAWQVRRQDLRKPAIVHCRCESSSPKSLDAFSQVTLGQAQRDYACSSRFSRSTSSGQSSRTWK